MITMMMMTIIVTAITVVGMTTCYPNPCATSFLSFAFPGLTRQARD